jgi:4-amino-4-deoxy-L-arabinose transferase-like glycosyltransferase
MFSSRRSRRLLIGLGLLVILCTVRFPWLEADSGNSTFWSYGYFSNDEAAYTSGGRHAYLTGRFLDPALNEPYNFGCCWSMHFLSYLGYRLAGLTLGAMRWPSMALAIAAWLAVYAIATRRTPALVAGIVIAVMSCNPVSLTYERTASTDVALGALAVLSFMAITARRPVLALAAGACMALACTVKANAVMLLPLVLLGAKQQRGPRLGLAAAAFGVGLAALWWGRQLAVIASSDGHDPAWVLAESSRWQIPLTSLRYNPADWLKPISVFPRLQCSLPLGPFVVWALALPAWWLLMFWWRTGRWWSRRHAVPVGMLIYTGALASQPTNALRHDLPLLFFVPLLLMQSRWLFRTSGVPPRRSAVTLLVGVTAVLALLYWWQTARGSTLEKVATIWYNEFTVPHNAWPISGARLIVGCLFMSVAIGNLLPRERNHAAGSRWLIGTGLAVVLVCLFFANYTISLLNIDSGFVINQILLQLSLAGTCAAILMWPAVRHRWKTWWLAHAFLLLAFMAGNSYWSHGYGELDIRTYFTRDASRQLAAVLPADAVVIGRRASTLLRNVPVRLGMCTQYEPDEFMRRIAGLLADHPVFWLIDGDEDSLWERCRDAVRKRWRISYVTTVWIPSADLLGLRKVEEPFPLIPIHLMRIGAWTETSAMAAPVP